MAAIDLNTSYTMTLTNEEMILTLRALGGRITNLGELERAKALGDRLTVARANIVRDRLKQNDALFKSLEEAGILEG